MLIEGVLPYDTISLTLGNVRERVREGERERERERERGEGPVNEEQ